MMNHSNPQQLYIASVLYVWICARWLTGCCCWWWCWWSFSFSFPQFIIYLQMLCCMLGWLSLPFSVRHTLLAVVVLSSCSLVKWVKHTLYTRIDQIITHLFLFDDYFYLLFHPKYLLKYIKIDIFGFSWSYAGAKTF